MLPFLAALVALLLLAGYRFYSRLIANQFRLDNGAETPAVRHNDRIDFVPTRPFYLLGQHFSAIAAAGPIAGPILACQQFGWFPCLLWIGLGVVLIGAAHDFSALVASVRHEGRSIAEIVKATMGKTAWLGMLGFIWITLVYVIVAFTDITAGTFVGRIEELEGVAVGFERGGAVAASSALYLLLAVLMGVVQKKLRLPLWLLTALFVPAALGAVWGGTKVSTLLLFGQKEWGVIILAYCFVASLLPIWLLLQPRGYLGGFVLFLALFVGVVGVFFGGYEIHQPFFRTWKAPGLTGSLFPFLFVTIACGACSGFHGLVCSGTTSKQIAREPHCRPIGYGGMLLEGFVAIIALATLLVLPEAEVKGSPGAIYGAGIGRFMTLLVGREHLLFAVTFGAMAFSTFVFDTLDVATRLARYILQELIGQRGTAAAFFATVVTLAVPLALLFIGREGGWSSFWVLFGTANQLLAGLTLLTISVWLKKTGRRFWFTFLPMLFVMTITFWSLVLQIHRAAKELITSGPLTITLVNGAAALVLLLLALLVIREALQKGVVRSQIV